MSINNNLSFERIKKTLDIKTIAITCVFVVFMSTIFYITIENLEKNEVLIWFVTTESDNHFSDETLKLINDYGKDNGIDKVLLTKRHPDDQYFDVTMSTSAYYNCDVFIMNKDMVQKYADMGMFLSLSSNGCDADNMLYLEDNAVGLSFDDNYYFLINTKTDIDLEVIYHIYDLLFDNYK